MSWVLGVLAGVLALFVLFKIEDKKMTKQINDLGDPVVDKGDPVVDKTEYENLYTTQEQYNRYDGTEY
jgi:hypothetical protein